MKREISQVLADMICDEKRKEVIIIEGARQVGKSYLVNDVLQSLKHSCHSFDFEKHARVRRQIDRTTDFHDFQTLFIDQYGVKKGDILFFDEAQECASLANYIKSFKEDWPEVKVILTGSSMNRLFSKGKRIPVGRMRSLCVFPFSFIEFLKHLRGNDLPDFIKSCPENIPSSRHELLLKYFDEYIGVGGYPEAVQAYKDAQSPYEVIDEIIAFLSEDFARKEEHHPRLFQNAIQAVADHIGGPSKYTHINTNKYQVRKVIEAMKAWHIVLEVEQRALDPQKRNFLPKRYLHDIGVINRQRTMMIPKISIIKTIDPALRTPLGGLFENAVLLNLLEGESAYKSIGTWKKGNNTDIEIDFVLDIPEERVSIPIECKAALKLYDRHFKNIVHYLNATQQSFGILISAAPFQVKTLGNKTMINLPVYLASRKNIRNYYFRLK